MQVFLLFLCRNMATTQTGAAAAADFAVDTAANNVQGLTGSNNYRTNYQIFCLQ
jgi:hypothetical protein